MGCCIFTAMLVSQLIWLWDKARQSTWLNVLAFACAAISFSLLAWHWHHIEALILDPLAFSFVSDLLNQAGSFCRALGND
ncbi:hypothetical protein PMI22_02285 [Pseudomonas sp. GM21]|uniref:hypothetical protein n=1 Tax=Pseudomonas sp. GM21 TaxID=1144325 RepID=UPI0002722F3A|nr:hypothetical protein [Pseudomonas sp. GM21]EJM21105.1 hypothetical protein PMI22_02285 [Pseudomonas sp. GM21]